MSIAMQQPTSENIEAVKKIMLNNYRITILGDADDVGISFGLCQKTFTDALEKKNSIDQNNCRLT